MPPGWRSCRPCRRRSVPNLPYHRAPPGLARASAQPCRARSRPAPVARHGSAGRLWHGRHWFRRRAGWRGVDPAGGGRPGRTWRQGVIGSHIRSMQAEHLTDVLTSDQHTVKPWLSARLDVSPQVRDLKDVGFPLVGGRLDYVDGHPGGGSGVPTRQARDQPVRMGLASKPTRRSTRRRSGFNLVTWRHDGITYYAVSDVEADQLQSSRNWWRRALEPPSTVIARSITTKQTRDV